jgi:3-oxoacyl-(acyl-carrier-protein) synthase
VSKGVPLNYAINNSFGFGGTNASLVLKKFVA